ncbi:MAG: EpsG family protein [Cellulomonas iranensis]|uniref:Transmembrane protein EpsG n=1 Tax=Cellulomonas iranensis TaxID=76862 RepID=A0ABU0GGW4_9CELL|nr:MULTISPECIES: EpsG family protein [Cellulomonas]MBO9568736.1 EpsG family protein [Cellulomonas iranensis]MDQ0424604.1 transmembrane protein EpsG [Cellulomonas iranensis]UCN14092.1 EpsG family protein [Cellulomonas iranensis]
MITSLTPYLTLLLLVTVTALTGLAVTRGIAAARPAGPDRPRAGLRAVPDPFVLVACAALALFSGLRWYVGSDFDLYARTYLTEVDPHDLAATLEVSRFEPGFALLSYGLRQVSDDPRLLFLVCAVLVTGLTYGAYRRLSPVPHASLVLWVAMGYYLGSMNLVRQSLAAAVLLYAFSLWRTHRVVAVVVGAVGISIHSSSPLFVVAVVAASLLPFAWRTMYVALAACLVAASVIVALPVVAQAAALLNEEFARYLNQRGGGLGVLLAAGYRVVLLVATHRLLRGRELDRPLTTALWMTTFGTCAWLVSASAMWTLRLDDYFGLFTPVLIPLAARAVPAGGARTTYLVVTSAATLVYFTFYVLNFSGLVPYAWTPFS